MPKRRFRLLITRKFFFGYSGRIQAIGEGFEAF
jgi:hypothetical protein